MPELSSGNTSFLYTDIQGSTRLWELYPQLMATVLDRHDQIWRAAVEGNKGHIFRVTGDGFCASFSHANSAVNAAAEAQRALSAVDWGPIERLQVRAILHTGIAEVRHGDYVGGSLNIAGRLLSVCHGGQTLLSPTTAELVRQELPAGTALLSLGRHRFRDIAEPITIYQLSITGLNNDFPPLSSLTTIPHNLPAQLTSFIGREKEKSEVMELLRDNRLVTLVGPGGTGKTRLSIEVAREIKESLADGVWLVELAAVNDPALVDHAVAATLDVQEQPGRAIRDSLSTYLRRKQILLILDNCEHLVDACARTAAALLGSSPGLRILASSRESLGIHGEAAYPLHPLALPEAGSRPENIAANDAVRLFLARAAQVRPDISLEAANAPAIARICRRLDGIPLAIELAAARIKHLSPEQIAARLDQSFRLLTGGSRAALPRQQTLRALIDWSYDLLSSAEQLLFRRLAVFYGGWTLEAAEAICAHGSAESSSLDPFEIMDLNGSLVEKSMVELDHKMREPRYRLLETMRQYGLEKLKEAGEALKIRDNHLAYYSAWAQEMELPILRSDDAAAVERLEADHDNMLAALEWASTGDSLLFINITAALGPYWSSVGAVTEARYWLDQSLAGIDVSGLDTGNLSYGKRIAQAFFFQGLTTFTQGQNESALAALDNALYVARLANDRFYEAQSLSLRSPALMNMGRMGEALATAKQGAAVARQLKDDLALSRALSALGGTMLRINGADPDAWRYMEESVAASRRVGDNVFITTPLLIMVEAAVSEHRLDLAWEKVQEGLALINASPNPTFRQLFSTKAADIYRLRGTFAEAIPIYQQAVIAWREIGNLGAVARCIECLAFIEIGRARQLSRVRQEEVLTHACRMLGAAQKIREDPERAMPDYEQVEYEEQVAALEELLDEGSFASAWANGRRMSLDEIEDYVT
ncbi:MAG: adenylate/guanylate cyclase domain-containing protein [Candidatus Promineifilaceae bacterium]|nr:adenylate/guanylate cyclase domain-containing protein [Candidatus Promineifilaceae bacterium]